MTQPRRNIGPPNVGGQADNAGSQPATGANFRKLQRHARGVAEWIDAAQTAGAPALSEAHDHRGGTYGRPLGSATTAQFSRRIGAGFATSFALDALFMIPDCTPASGIALRDPSANGGFVAPKIWIYAESAAATTISLNLSVREVGNRENSVFAGLVFNHPGGGKAWLTATDQVVLPSGFVSVSAAAPIGAVTSIEQLCLEIPH